MMAKRKKIIFVADKLDVGGIASFIQSCDQYLHKHNCELLLVGKPGTATTSKEYFSHSRYYPVIPALLSGNNPLVSALNFLKESIAFRNTIHSILREQKITAIHFNDPTSAIGVLFFSPLLSRIPRIYTFHGDRAQELLSEGIRHPVRFFNIQLMKHIQLFVLRRCTAVVAVSKFSKNYLIKKLKLPVSRVKLIPNGIDSNFFRSSPGKISGKSKEFNLLNISRFERRKGHILLLQAVRTLLDQKVNVVLDICGPMEGDIQPILLEYQRLNLLGHVRFLHEVSQFQKLQMMSKASVFILSSTALENCPFSAIEALAQGLPVVGTPVGGIPEMLKPIHSSLISADPTAASLARSIRKTLLLSSKAKNTLSSQCVREAQRLFNSDKNYKAYELLYQV